MPQFPARHPESRGIPLFSANSNSEVKFGSQGKTFPDLVKRTSIFGTSLLSEFVVHFLTVAGPKASKWILVLGTPQAAKSLRKSSTIGGGAQI